MHASCLKRPEEGVGSSGTGFMESENHRMGASEQTQSSVTSFVFV